MLEQVLQPNPLVVPEQLPTRYELAAQFWLLHTAQLNPLLVPEQEPARYELEAQLTLLQPVHVCAAVPEPPCRNWLDGQVG